MNDYQQPDFFRFGHDSLDLIRWVKSKVTTSTSILDLGAGSGIIGIELANLLHPQKLTLLEVQREFLPYLEENLSQQLKSSTKGEIVLGSFADWTPVEKYDLIVSNPPYFLPGHGLRSPDERRELARTFKRDGWSCFFHLIENSLTPLGAAFLVIKNDKLILNHLKEKVPETLSLSEEITRDVVFLKLAVKVGI